MISVTSFLRKRFTDAIYCLTVANGNANSNVVSSGKGISSLLDLLHGGHPILHVIGRRKLAVPDGEHVYRDRLEALAGGLNAEQLARRGAGGLTPDHDSVARSPNILDGPVQVWDYLPQGANTPAN